MGEVQLHGVSKIFRGNVRAVDDLNLDVRDGELLVLVGPSGCGKSTTLRLIAGLERPTSGDVHLGGERVNEVSPAKRNVAMVFQYDALLPHLSVRKNLGFGLELARGGWLRRILRSTSGPAVRREEIHNRVAEVAQQLGVESLLERQPSELSGGQRQRVALGRAMVRRPKLFLLDEPLSHLDVQLRAELRAELKRLHARLGTTMIYVTHDQHEAMTLGDRLAVMDRGRIWQVAAPLEIYDRPAHRVVASLVGSPPMNFFTGQWQQRGEKRLFCGGGVSVEFPPVGVSRLDEHLGKSVILGIRPEQVACRQLDAGSHPPASWLAGSGLAMIDMVEALGDSTILRLRLENGATTNEETRNSIASKIMGRTHLRPGDRVEFVIDPAQCHLFHATTGENLIGAS